MRLDVGHAPIATPWRDDAEQVGDIGEAHGRSLTDAAALLRLRSRGVAPCKLIASGVLTGRNVALCKPG